MLTEKQLLQICIDLKYSNKKSDVIKIEDEDNVKEIIKKCKKNELCNGCMFKIEKDNLYIWFYKMYDEYKI